MDIIEQSRSIAAEIVLERLLVKLLAIVINRANATRGILILLKDDGLRIEAIAQASENSGCVLQSTLIKESGLLPVSVIHDVANTRSNVRLANATCEGKFTSDPFIAQQQFLSILCIPLTNCNDLIGVLYLENQTTDAFSSICLEALEILCAQSAISIKNALLYQSLEQKLAERSDQLIEVNAALQASETERQCLKSELQAQQTFLQQVIDVVPSSIVVRDSLGQFLALNQAAAVMYGSSVEAMVGKTDLDFNFDRQAIVEDWSHQEVIATRQTKIISEQAIDNAPDHLRWYQTTISPLINTEDQITGTISFAVNITDRKQAETAQQEQLHLLQVILDALPFPIFYKDDRGIYLGCNRSFLEYRGMSEAQVVGKSVYETAPAHMAEVYEEADQALFASRGIQTYETTVAYADGSQHEVIFYKAAFLNRQGGLGGLVGAILDINDRKQAEAALQASLEQLARANQEIKLLNYRLESENLRLSAELAVARQLQQIMLPKEQEFSQIEGLEIAAFMRPADEVGGDYHDILRHGDVVKIGIGDVTGHGLESGILMIMAQTAVRTLLLSNETDPQRFLNTINQVIYENIQRMNSNRNLSLALLDYQAGRVKLSGQHEEMLVVRSNGQIERIDTVDLGFLLGIVPDINDFITQIEVQLQPGDGVVLYTDGITEAENLTKEYYGLDRLCQVVSQYWQHSADEIRQVVVEDVQMHIGKQKVYDDMTLLVLKQY